MLAEDAAAEERASMTPEEKAMIDVQMLEKEIKTLQKRGKTPECVGCTTSVTPPDPQVQALELELWKEGTRVEIYGLEKAKHHNGKSGVLGECTESDERWVVKLDNGEKPLLVRRANLLILIECCHCGALMPRDIKAVWTANLVPIMQCHGCNGTTNVVTGKPAHMPPRVSPLHADPSTIQELELSDDPVLENCRVEVNIYEESGSNSASAEPIATIECRNGLHIEHVSSGVSRDRKALLRDVAAVCENVRSKQDAKKVLAQLNDPDAAYHIKLPVNIKLHGHKPTVLWRIDVLCRVNGGLQHTLVFRTMLSGVIRRWCEVVTNPQSSAVKVLEAKSGDMVRIVQASWKQHNCIIIPDKSKNNYVVCGLFEGDIEITGMGVRLSAMDMLFPPKAAVS